jgi:hypothetical protein
MKVNIAFEFSDGQLRTIRGGKGKATATRKQCRAFVEGAVGHALVDIELQALKVARTVAPPVVKRARPAADVCTCTEEQLCPACKEARARIARQFGHEGRA